MIGETIVELDIEDVKALAYEGMRNGREKAVVEMLLSILEQAAEKIKKLEGEHVR